MTQAYSDPTRANDPEALPDLDVFKVTASEFINANSDTWMSEMLIGDWDADSLAGWYYWPCFPGCLPDGDPVGPFDSAAQAILHAQQEEEPK